MAKKDIENTDRLRGREVRVPSHGHGVLYPFRKGRSGNPGGVGGLYHEAMQLARLATPAATRRMIELINSDDHRVGLMASMAIWDRAFGKPKESEVDAMNGRVKLDLSKVTPEQLVVLRSIVEQARAKAQTPEDGLSCSPG